MRNSNRNLNSSGICPPGVFCITPGVLMIVTLFFLFLGAILYLRFTEKHPMHIERPPTNIQIVTPRTSDDRYTRAPEPTRGYPEAYQSMGLLKKIDGQLVPLYGRRLASRSDRFNYYTRTDTYNPVPLPIHYKRRDCQDDIGCEELSNGDKVRISPTGEEAEATLYRFDGPTYLPF